MKIIYLYERRLPYENDNITFGYDDVRAYGWDIEVWCLLGLTSDVDVNAMPEGINLDTGDYVKYINTFKDFEGRLRYIDKKDVFFLCYPYHVYDKSSYHIRKKLHEYNFKFANVTESPGVDNYLLREVPFGISQAIKHFIRRYILGGAYYLLMWLKSLCRDSVFRKNFRDCWYRLIGPIVYPSCYNFITTELEYYFTPQPFGKWLEKNVLIHASSFTEYLREIDNPECSVKGNYVVFIDQGLINRNEVFLAMEDEIPIKSPEKYVKDLCLLFSKIEKDYGCDVVIAAHPKAVYANDTFGGRQIIFGKTPELIKNAKLVIHQFSTSFFLVVLFKKDFINVYTKEMWETPRQMYKEYYKGFNLIGCKQLDISDERTVDSYKDYIFSYEEHEYNKFENLAIIDEKSNCRKKRFYTYVCEILDKNLV